MSPYHNLLREQLLLKKQFSGDNISEGEIIPVSPFEEIHKELRGLIASGLQLSEDQLKYLKLEKPPTEILADLALATFELGKVLRVPPHQIAERIADYIQKQQISWLKRVRILGLYVNFEIDEKRYYSRILNHILSLDNRFGSAARTSNSVVFINSVSPTLTSIFDLDRLRSLFFAQVLRNIYQKAGFPALTASYVTDWNVTTGEILLTEEAHKDSFSSYSDAVKLHKRFVQDAQIDESLKAKAKLIFRQLESGDKKTEKLWNDLLQKFTEDLRKAYSSLGLKFDFVIFESFFLNLDGKTLEDLIKSQVTKTLGDGHVLIVEFPDQQLPVLLRKNDGTALPIVRNLANLSFIAENFHPRDIINLVDEKEKSSWDSIETLARKIHYLPAESHYHTIVIAPSLLDDKAVPHVEDVLLKLKEHAQQKVSSDSSDFSRTSSDEISYQIAHGVLLYYLLRQSPTKPLTFDWSHILNLESNDSALYLQYTHARISSLLQKIPVQQEYFDEFVFADLLEMSLAKELVRFPEVIQEASRENAPHIICIYLEEVAHHFNSLYNAINIKNTSEPALLASRVALAESTRVVLRNGLATLTIACPLIM